MGDKIVVVGGQADGKLVRQTEVFDGKRWTDVAELPTPREHLAAASDGRYLYAVGGRDLSAAKNLPTLERYDPADDSWTKLDDMPDAVGSVGAAYVDGLVVTVGGEGVTEPSDAVQALRRRVEPVVAAPGAARPAPRGRRGHARGFALRDRRRRRRRPRRADGHGERARLRLSRSRVAYSASGFGACVEVWPMYVTCSGSRNTFRARCSSGTGARKSTTVSPNRNTSPSRSGRCRVTRSPFR